MQDLGVTEDEAPAEEAPVETPTAVPAEVPAVP